MRTTESAFRRNLGLLREQGLQAIESKSIDSFKRILRRHVELVSDYLKARSAFQGGIRQTKPTMIGLLGYESQVVYEICSSIEELVRRAFQVQNEDVIPWMGVGLIEALSIAVENDAYEVFKRIAALIQRAFFFTFSVEDQTRRQRLLDRLTSLVKEFCDYRLVATFLEESPKRIPSLARYGVVLIQNNTQLIKETVDRRDLKSFSSLVDASTGILAPGLRDLGSDLLSLNLKLEHFQLSASERKQAHEAADRLKEQIEFFRVVSQTKRDAFYALGSWAVRRYDNAQLEPKQFQEIFSRILPQLGDFEDVTSLYVRHLSDSADPYGWTMWETAERGEIQGGAFRPTSEKSVHEFYVLAAIRTLPSLPNDDRLRRTLKMSSISAALVEMTAVEIREICTSMSSEPRKWRTVLPELEEQPADTVQTNVAVTEKFQLFIEVWDRLLEWLRAQEENDLLESELSKESLEEFESHFRKAWNQASVFRTLAKGFHFYQDHLSDPNVPDTVTTVGFNKLERKEWFIAGNSYAARSIGENLGTNLGRHETTQLFEQITSAIEPIVVATPEEARESLDIFIDGIEDASSYVLIASQGYDYEAKLYESGFFERTRKFDGDQVFAHFVLGKYRNLPLVPIWIPDGGKKPSLVCADMQRLGVLHQYWIDTPGREIEISVKKIGESEASALLRENPRLKTNQAGQEESDEDAIFRLRKSVHLKIREKYSYSLSEDRQAIRIDLQKQGSSA